MRAAIEISGSALLSSSTCLEIPVIREINGIRDAFSPTNFQVESKSEMQTFKAREL